MVSTDCNQCLVTYVISVAECRVIQCLFFSSVSEERLVLMLSQPTAQAITCVSE